MDEGEQIAAKLRRRYGLIAAVTAVLLVTGGGGLAWVRVHTQAAKLTSAVTVTNERVASWRAADRVLDELIDEAEALLVVSEGRVMDDTAREELADAVQAARMVADGPAPAAASREDGLSRARELRMLARTALECQEIVTADLRAAIGTVTGAVTAWELARAVDGLDQALVELDAVVAAGEELLAGTEGQVADNSVRQQLREALDMAIAVRDHGVDRDGIDTVVAATEQVRAAAGPLEAASTEVSGAHEAWQATESEQVESEQAAAAARSSAGITSDGDKTSKSSGGPKGSAAKTGGTGPSGRPSTGGGGGTGSGSGGGYWVDAGDVDLGYNGCFGGDQYGNSWQATC